MPVRGARSDAFDCYMEAAVRCPEGTCLINNNTRMFTIASGFRKCHDTVGPLPTFARWRLGHELPSTFLRAHLTHQDRLFEHLRAAWADDRPRVMVDLGCSATHGHHRNLSDALLWLHHFNSTGSLVVGVDIDEDLVLDQQHRFDDIWPFNSLKGVEKHALHLAISNRDSSKASRGAMARFSNKVCDHVSFGKMERERKLKDHYCRITRQRLGLSNGSPWPLPPSEYPDFWRAALENRSLGMSLVQGRGHSPKQKQKAIRFPTSHVRRARADGLLWRQAPLNGRRIDFLKVKLGRQMRARLTDAKLVEKQALTLRTRGFRWRDFGLEQLLESRAVGALVVEMDVWWKREYGYSPTKDKYNFLNVSQLDMLVWFARHNGYASFLKIPCCAKPLDGLEAASPRRLDGHLSTYYLQLASPGTPYEPTGIDMVTTQDMPQDLLIIDASDQPAIATVLERGKASCLKEHCCDPNFRDDTGKRQFCTGHVHSFCKNTCKYARNGYCQDGGSGAVDDSCKGGTDCADCGRRWSTTVFTSTVPELEKELSGVIRSLRQDGGESKTAAKASIKRTHLSSVGRVVRSHEHVR